MIAPRVVAAASYFFVSTLVAVEGTPSHEPGCGCKARRWTARSRGWWVIGAPDWSVIGCDGRSRRSANARSVWRPDASTRGRCLLRGSIRSPSVRWGSSKEPGSGTSFPSSRGVGPASSCVELRDGQAAGDEGCMNPPIFIVSGRSSLPAKGERCRSPAGVSAGVTWGGQRRETACFPRTR